MMTEERTSELKDGQLHLFILSNKEEKELINNKKE
jgi:hypothetical protein